MTTLAQQVEGLRTVSGSTERDLLFPSPAAGQKVYNQSTDTIERWTGTAWVSAVRPFGAYNVMDFGAVGDGVTNDKAAFKAAVAACQAGGTVFVPRTASFFSIDTTGGESDAILIDKQLTVIIDGRVKATFGAVQTNPPCIFRITGTGVTICGFGSIEGDGTTNQTNTGLESQLPSLVRAEGNQFTMTEVTIVTPYKIGLYLWGCYNAKIVNCKFTGGPAFYSDTSYFAIRGNQGGKHTISGNQFFPDAGNGMFVSCIFLNNANECVVNGNVATKPWEKLIYGAGSYNIISNNSIIGWSSSDGYMSGTKQWGTVGAVIRIDGAYNKVIGNFARNVGGGCQGLDAYGSHISGNTFLNCGNGGISVFNSGASSVVYDDITIEGNLIVQGDIDNAIVGDGILVRPTGGPSKYIRISNNTVRGFSKAGVAGPIVNIAAWTALTTFPKFGVVKPTVANNFYYAVDTSYSAGGVSGSSQPTWPTSAGATVVDGSIRWIAVAYDIDTYAQIRLEAPGAGQEAKRCVVHGNNLGEGARGIRLGRVDTSFITNNRIHATEWGIVESNGSNIVYFENVVEGAANTGISGKAATSQQVDFKSGSWVPVITDGTTDATMLGTGSNNGGWVRHGGMVTAWGSAASSSVAALVAGAAVRIKGLPYACAAGAAFYNGIAVGEAVGLNITANQNVVGRVEESQKYIALKLWDAATGTTALLVSEWSDDGNITFTVTYFTNDAF